MFLLPKGTPLAENIPASKIDLPSVLNKLRNPDFSGYALVSLHSTSGVFLYIDGKLISAFFQRAGNSRLQDLDAIHASIESLVLNSDATFSAYRLNRDISIALLALFKGNVILNAQEMKLIDFRAVLEKIKSEQMNACLKVYTGDRAGLIFYRNGAPIGFFHDTALQIEMTQTEVQKIAVLPGARIDVQAIKENDVTSSLLDLNYLIDIAKVWSEARENVFSKATDSPVPSSSSRISATTESISSASGLDGLHTGLIEIAVIHLGKLGRTLMEKELAKAGGPQSVIAEERLEELLTALEKGAKLLTSSFKIRQLQESIRTEVARYS